MTFVATSKIKLGYPRRNKKGQKQMAAKTAISAKNLEALGPGRLAELLVEISAGDPAVKRRLRMELAAAQSPAELTRGAY